MLSGSGPTEATGLIVWCCLVLPELEACCLCLSTFIYDVIVVGHSKMILLEVCRVLEGINQNSSRSLSLPLLIRQLLI